MKSATVKAFLSCSFKEEDKDINSVIKAICEGLDIACENVDGGYAELPPEKALDMIKNADIVIAIAVARSKFELTEFFSMPEAVSNEISFAYSLDKPILIIKEDNVKADGFLKSYGTHLTFNRKDILQTALISKLVKSIHCLKLGALSDHELILSQEVTEFIAESVSHLYELEREGDGFCWQHSMQRTIKFSKNYNKSLKISRWNDFSEGKSSDGLKSIELNFEIIKSSRPFEYSIEFEENTAFGITGNVSFTPAPIIGDWIEYFLSYRGQHLCATYLEDTDGCPSIEIDGRNFIAYDFIIPINRAKDLEIQFRLPREYRVAESDASFFVASFVQGIDYVVESEIQRAEVKKEVIGGKLSITAKISSPLMRHAYGVAWNPPSKQKN